MIYRQTHKKVARIRIQGPDRVGIISTVTGFLNKNLCNIEDIDQRILDDYLVMNMVVDYTPVSQNVIQFEKQLHLTAQEVGCQCQWMPVDRHLIKNVALLVTKESHCLIDLLEKMKSNTLKANPSLIIGNQDELKVLAQKYKVPFYFVSSTNKKIHEQKVLKLLDKHQIDLVVLARYMQILSPEFVFRYEGKIINIHPSLLPAFPGPRSYHQAHNKGVDVVGVTAHFATTDLDEGPIIAQDCFRVNKSKDTVESYIKRGQKLEAKVLTKAVKLFVEDRLLLRRGRVLTHLGRRPK